MAQMRKRPSAKSAKAAKPANASSTESDPAGLKQAHTAPQPKAPTATANSDAAFVAYERQRQNMLRWLNLAMVVVVAYIGISYVRFIRSNDPDQPLTVLHEDFLAPDVFHEVQECLANDALLHRGSGNVLNQRNFKGTYGYVAKFNAHGVEKFKQDPLVRCLIPYYESVVRNDTNAWCVNVLVCQESEAPVSVGLHVDDTVGIKVPVLQFLAHQVDVLYVRVPQSMQGGSLNVWQYQSRPSSFAFSVDHDHPDRQVTPRENRRVSFRGDAFHMVRGFRIPDHIPKADRLRISLVVEQYKIPTMFYGLTHVYNFAYKQNMTMM